MPEITVRNRVLSAEHVVKLPAGKGAEVLGAMAKNGADDVMVKVGEDTMVFSGRGMALGGVKAGQEVRVGDQVGTVLHVDKQLNSFMDGMKAWPGLAVAGVGGAWGLIGFAQGVLAGANMAGIGLIIAAGAVVAGVAINLVPAAYGALRKVDADAVGRG